MKALALTWALAAAAAVASLAGAPAVAQTAPTAPPASTPPATKPANEQVIVPEVERRDVKLPRFPNKDFTLGVFGGTYSVENFGTSGVSGVRLGYAITEDIFVEATYGRTKVSDEAFRQILPGGGIFVTPKQNLTYYNVVAGYNLLPGEVFFGRKNAKAWQGYVLAGVGSTTLAGQKKQTIVAGFGLRLIFNDWVAVQADVRDHMFSLDLLGKRTSTHNPEITAGLTLTF
jgi:outer membrane beta-barrel protein